MKTKAPAKSGLYAIQFSTGVKIGRASNLASRLKSYVQPWALPIKEVFWVETKSPVVAEAIALLAARVWYGHPISGSEFFRPAQFDGFQHILTKAVGQAEAAASSLTPREVRISTVRRAEARLLLQKEYLEEIEQAAKRVTSNT